MCLVNIDVRVCQFDQLKVFSATFDPFTDDLNQCDKLALRLFRLLVEVDGKVFVVLGYFLHGKQVFKLTANLKHEFGGFLPDKQRSMVHIVDNRTHCVASQLIPEHTQNLDSFHHLLRIILAVARRQHLTQQDSFCLFKTNVNLLKNFFGLA